MPRILWRLWDSIFTFPWKNFWTTALHRVQNSPECMCGWLREPVKFKTPGLKTSPNKQQPNSQIFWRKSSNINFNATIKKSFWIVCYNMSSNIQVFESFLHCGINIIKRENAAYTIQGIYFYSIAASLNRLKAKLENMTTSLMLENVKTSTVNVNQSITCLIPKL